MRFGSRALLSATVVTALALTGAACGSDKGGGGGGDALSVDRIRDLAAKTKDGADTCPVDWDLVAAAKAAGVEGRVGPQAGKDAVKGELPQPDVPSPDDMLESVDGALLECAYEINGEKASVFASGAGKGRATNMLLPLIAATDELGMSKLSAYAEEAGKAGEGSVLLTPNNTAATVRLPENGGDVVLTFVTGSTRADAKSSLTPDQVSRIAEELAGQVGG
ncbi:hypothetical protein SRB5_63800 [Streptomyces sp. RB5]|uniref:Lipoprotein n=1 Tax=Streptomyces smaragdinus TaxID=2585196 RepID=A0A7K0CTZ1_9ACTN|nr:hypothetical protein [Streptomyces smaragdinus]MQY16184.1 hypothetical protein [Streptomyces smaragdinus]